MPAPGSPRRRADVEVGLLILVAGANTHSHEFLDGDLAEFQRVIDLNVSTPLALVHHYGQPMRARRRGGIVLLGSLAGLPRIGSAHRLRRREGVHQDLRRGALVGAPGARRRRAGPGAGRDAHTGDGAGRPEFRRTRRRRRRARRRGTRGIGMAGPGPVHIVSGNEQIVAMRSDRRSGHGGTRRTSRHAEAVERGEGLPMTVEERLAALEQRLRRVEDELAIGRLMASLWTAGRCRRRRCGRRVVGGRRRVRRRGLAHAQPGRRCRDGAITGSSGSDQRRCRPFPRPGMRRRRRRRCRLRCASRSWSGTTTTAAATGCGGPAPTMSRCGGRPPAGGSSNAPAAHWTAPPRRATAGRRRRRADRHDRAISGQGRADHRCGRRYRRRHRAPVRRRGRESCRGRT